MHVDAIHKHGPSIVVEKDSNDQNKILSYGNTMMAQKPLIEFGEWMIRQKNRLIRKGKNDDNDGGDKIGFANDKGLI